MYYFEHISNKKIIGDYDLTKSKNNPFANYLGPGQYYYVFDLNDYETNQIPFMETPESDQVINYDSYSYIYAVEDIVWAEPKTSLELLKMMNVDYQYQLDYDKVNNWILQNKNIQHWYEVLKPWLKGMSLKEAITSKIQYSDDMDYSNHNEYPYTLTNFVTLAMILNQDKLNPICDTVAEAGLWVSDVTNSYENWLVAINYNRHLKPIDVISRKGKTIKQLLQEKYNKGYYTEVYDWLKPDYQQPTEKSFKEESTTNSDAIDSLVQDSLTNHFN